MSFALIEVQLSADIAAGGTLTLPYPSGDAAADFDTAANHRATYNGVTYSSTASDFSLAFNAGDITFTNGASNVTLAADRILRVQAEKRETAATANFFEVIEASDASLGINGLDAAQGGAVVVTGGTSTGAGNAGGAISQFGGTPGATGVGGAASVKGGAGGATSGAGGAASLVGGASTAGNSVGGTAKVTGGAGAGSGNGAAALVTGGLAGATGTGGAVTLTGGAGGATSGVGGNVSATGGAGTANNDDGGSVVLTGGAPHGTGNSGVVAAKSVLVQVQAAPVAKTTSSTLTAADLLTGLITVTQGAGATSTQTLPTGTLMDAALPADFAVDDSFEFSVINLGAALENFVLAAGAGFTIVGNANIEEPDAITNSSSGTFRCRKTAANTFVAYRVS